MKGLRVFLLPPGRGAIPSQVNPPALNSPVPIYTPWWKEHRQSRVSWPRTQHIVPGQGSSFMSVAPYRHKESKSLCNTYARQINDLLLYIKTEEKIRANHLSAAISLICLTLRKRKHNNRIKIAC